MPRSLVKGTQILDRSITDKDLATDSVTTEKIKDYNVTCEKLAQGLCSRFLSSSTPIGRTRILNDFPADQDFVVPGGLSYDPILFSERVAIYRNGQLLYGGNQKPTSLDDPTEVYPGSTNQHIKFSYNLIRGDIIQVITL